MHQSIKEALGFNKEVNKSEILAEWKQKSHELCKPCWELHYCPYGPMIEDFPLLPLLRKVAVEHNEYLKECLMKGLLKNGEKLDSVRKKDFRKEIEDFDENKYPVSIPKVLNEASCRVFGHICPVFFVAEPLTETKNRRTHSRHISAT